MVRIVNHNGYKTDYDAERVIMNYLINKIESEHFKPQELTENAIVNAIVNADSSFSSQLIKKILKELTKSDNENEAKIIVKQSMMDLYIPSNLQGHKNLIEIELGDPLEKITKILMVGITSTILISGLIPIDYIVSSLNNLFNYANTSKSTIIFPMIIISVGFASPLALGIIVLGLYDYAKKILSKINIDKTQFYTIIFTSALALVLYFGLSYYMKYEFQPYAIVALLLAGIGAGAVLSSTLARNKSKQNNK